VSTSQVPAPPWEALEAAALAVQRNAYAPYSKYHVGASIWTTSGRFFSGCNVENASYGLCCCAERSAIAAMVSAGQRDLAALAVVTTGDTPGSPCGMCRQVLSEFALLRPVPVRLLAERSGQIVARVDSTVPELLPLAFLPSVLLDEPGRDG
jgi:cytidine deaminase